MGWLDCSSGFPLGFALGKSYGAAPPALGNPVNPFSFTWINQRLLILCVFSKTNYRKHHELDKVSPLISDPPPTSFGILGSLQTAGVPMEINIDAFFSYSIEKAQKTIPKKPRFAPQVYKKPLKPCKHVLAFLALLA